MPGGNTMKKAAILFLAVFLVVSFAAPEGWAGKKHRCYKKQISGLDDIDFDVDDGTLIVESDIYEDEYVEITEDYELYVNGRFIELNDYQQELVKEYYDQYFELIDYAKKIGLEGAKIGVHGAKIGLLAMASICKLMLASYDSEDLERDLEKEARRLERKAEKLEKKAEQIEEMAERLEDLHYEMRDEITVLEDLGWF
jgi:hypothetical protein